MTQNAPRVEVGYGAIVAVWDRPGKRGRDVAVEETKNRPLAGERPAAAYFPTRLPWQYRQR